MAGRDENLCPECDGEMVSRQNKTSGQRFWAARSIRRKGTRNTDGEPSEGSRQRESQDHSPFDRARENDHRQRWRRSRIDEAKSPNWRGASRMRCDGPETEQTD